MDSMTQSYWHQGIIWLMVLTLSACQPPPPQVHRPPPLPQDPFVEVYFNHSLSTTYKEPYRSVTRPGDNLEQIITQAIATAQSTVDVAVQELRLPNIAQALVKRHQAGVRVRVILENTYNRPWSEVSAQELAQLPPRERDRAQENLRLIDRDHDGTLTPAEINQRDALVILRNAGVPILDDTADGSQGSGLMHHKFVIVDGYTVVVTSANFTTSDIHGDFQAPDSRGNANNLLKIESVELANFFTEEFNQMWGDGLGGNLDSRFGVKKSQRSAKPVTLGDTTLAVKFSPTSPNLPWSQSSNGLIENTLQSATRTIDLALFVFSEQRLANQLQTAHEKGVQVQALIDPSFAYRYYSEGLDLLGVALSNQCRYEAGNRPWHDPIATVGVPQLPSGDLLHHKFGVVDGKTVITGSHNWSASANTQNDETLLVINSPLVAAHFEREFERLYGNAILGVPVAVQQRIQNQQQSCDEITQANDPNTSSFSGIINLNTATQEELETLPGIGPKLAERIIAARSQKPFTSLADLDQVSGIGPHLLQQLEGRVTW